MKSKGDAVEVVVDGITFRGTVEEVVVREGPEEHWLRDGLIISDRRRSTKYRVSVPSRGDSFYFFDHEVV